MKNMDLDVISAAPSVPPDLTRAPVPTFSHMLLVALHKAGKLKCVVTSNHDNLHKRSGAPPIRTLSTHASDLQGLPPDAVVEMHGNVYEEMCTSCGKIFTRQTHVPCLGAHLTGRVRLRSGPLSSRSRRCARSVTDSSRTLALTLDSIYRRHQ